MTAESGAELTMPTDRRPPIPAFLGRLAEPLYRAVIARRNLGFDAGRRVTKLPVPVISVGNLSVGGTGKTPMVERIVEWLREEGFRPAIAMRGYRARAGQRSDEEAQYAARFPDTPIAASPDRLAALKPVLARSAADCVVLDDGFQHRFIARDLDIVLVDATRSPFDDRCLPAGWLREPVESLRRAGMVILTHAESAGAAALDELRARVRALAPSTPLHASRHEWWRVRVAASLGSSSYHAEEPGEWLRDRPVVIACGIGNPGPFINAVRSRGARVLGVIEAPDHHEWRRTDLADVRARLKQQPSGALVTTEKDFVKFARLETEGLIIARPSLVLGFDDEAAIRAAVVEAAEVG